MQTPFTVKKNITFKIHASKSAGAKVICGCYGAYLYNNLFMKFVHLLKL